MHLSIWLPILAVAFGFLSHALSTDGGGSVLARLGITDWALPKSAVAPMVIVFGLGAAIFEGVQHGLSWEEAAGKGVLASLSVLFGVVSSQHLTGRDGDGRSMSILGFIGAGVLALALQACALFTPQNVQTALDIAEETCVIEHAFVDDATMNKVCKLVTPEQRARGAQLAAAHRAAVGQRMAAMRAEACDAGTDAR